MRDSFSRVTATLAESVLGVRVTQGFVRQDENARLFRELATDHSGYNYAVLRTYGLFLPLLDLNNQFFIAVLLLVGGAAGTGARHTRRSWATWSASCSWRTCSFRRSPTWGRNTTRR